MKNLTDRNHKKNQQKFLENSISKMKNAEESICSKRDHTEYRMNDQRTGTQKNSKNEQEQTVCVIYGTPSNVQILD